MTTKEQSSTLTPKIHLPNKDLVGLKKSEEKKRNYKRKRKITSTYGLENFSFTFQNEREN